MSIVILMAEPVSPASFGVLYQRHSRQVYRFALAMTGDEPLAEDLTAEAFLRVWESGSRIDWMTVRAYLLAIVRNLHHNEWRRARRRVEMPDQIAAPASDPDAKIELLRVLEALRLLPQLDRETLVLRAEGGLSYEEIAALVGGTAEAARVRAHRARKKLTEELCRKT